jgi:LacI family transcriptional regulator
LNLESVQIRRAAFLSGLKSHGLSERALIEKGDHRIEGGAIAMKNLLALPQRPTAVIASNDLTAIGALGAIHEAGLKVPDDLSLVGFDDISFAHLTQPPLTTVILSRTQLAVTAFAALEKLIRKEEGPHVDYTISTHLVLRSSTRAI